MEDLGCRCRTQDVGWMMQDLGCRCRTWDGGFKREMQDPRGILQDAG